MKRRSIGKANNIAKSQENRQAVRSLPVLCIMGDFNGGMATMENSKQMEQPSPRGLSPCLHLMYPGILTLHLPSGIPGGVFVRALPLAGRQTTGFAYSFGGTARAMFLHPVDDDIRPSTDVAIVDTAQWTFGYSVPRPAPGCGLPLALLAALRAIPCMRPAGKDLAAMAASAIFDNDSHVSSSSYLPVWRNGPPCQAILSCCSHL